MCTTSSRGVALERPKMSTELFVTRFVRVQRFSGPCGWLCEAHPTDGDYVVASVLKRSRFKGGFMDLSIPHQTTVIT